MLRVHKIVPESHVDGPGQRVVLFLQGCPIHCAGCQNKALWPARGGSLYDEEMLATRLAFFARDHGNITISGGEPFAQPGALAKLVYFLKVLGMKHIIVYSGYTWDTLTSPVNGILPWVQDILDHVDVLVDGPFVRQLDDNLITYRGSRNQRPIDVRATIETGQVVTLNWDNPEVVITERGDLLMPVGLADDLAELGQALPAAMCGQTRGR